MSCFVHVFGVICEYNPFHNGHRLHLEQTRRQATHVAAVMSGNFVQRGEPALLDKWTRARMALQNGVDLVLELPLPWAMAGAERFAAGGVATISALGCAEALSFGCEHGSAAALQSAARALLSPALGEALRPLLDAGLSFAAAREEAVRQRFGDECAALLQSPNDILAVEYAKAILRSHSQLSLFPVRRLGAAHDGEHLSPENRLPTGEAVASASALRQALQKNENITEFIPQSCRVPLLLAAGERRISGGMEPLTRAVLARLRTMTASEASSLPDVSEGLHNRLLSAARCADSLPALYAAAKTKRYSHARIRRAAAAALLGLREEDCSGTPPYLRVLGLNRRGQEILRQMKQTAALPVILRPSEISKLDKRAQRVFSLECAATDLWALSTGKILPAGLDFSTPLVTEGL